MDQLLLENSSGTSSIAGDIAGFGVADEEHYNNLHQLICVVREHVHVFNRDKYEIKKQSNNFFGLLYDANGVHPDQQKIKAAEYLQLTESKKGVTAGVPVYCHIVHISPTSHRIHPT